MFNSQTSTQRQESLRRLEITPSGGVIPYAVACKIYNAGYNDERKTPSGQALPGPGEPLWTRYYTDEKMLAIYQCGVRDYAMSSARKKGPTNTYGKNKLITGTDEN